MDTKIVYATLAGGMSAYDVMADIPTRATLSTNDMSMKSNLQKYFESDMFACDIIHDARGVEYAGVLKNIISIQAGRIQ